MSSLQTVLSSRVSAFEAMSNPDDAEKTACIQELLDAMDSYFPVPERDVDKPFLMPIEDIFSIQVEVLL